MSRNKVELYARKDFASIRGSMLKLGLPQETVMREISFALQALNKNSYLRSCSRESILTSVLNSAQVGLTLNPVSKEAYLVPHKGECVLYPGYGGLIKLIVDAGAVSHIVANVVYEMDDFEMNIAERSL